MSGSKERRRYGRIVGVVSSLTDISVAQLVASSVQGLILDLDNTLVAERSDQVEPCVQWWLQNAKDTGLKLVILSNRPQSRLSAIAQLLGVHGMGDAKKPSPEAFAAACRHLRLPPSKVVVVGDQVATDALGGWWSGVDVILVRPCGPARSWKSRSIRPIDFAYRVLYGALKRH